MTIVQSAVTAVEGLSSTAVTAVDLTANDLATLLCDLLTPILKLIGTLVYDLKCDVETILGLIGPLL